MLSNVKTSQIFVSSVYKHPCALKLNITLLTASNEYLLLYLTKFYQMLKHPNSSSLVFYKHPSALKLNNALLITCNEYLLLYLNKFYQMLKHPKSLSQCFTNTLVR